MQEVQIHYGKGAHTQYASKFYLHAVTEALQFLQGHSVQVGRTCFNSEYLNVVFVPGTWISYVFTWRKEEMERLMVFVSCIGPL